MAAASSIRQSVSWGTFSSDTPFGQETLLRIPWLKSTSLLARVRCKEPIRREPVLAAKGYFAAKQIVQPTMQFIVKKPPLFAIRPFAKPHRGCTISAEERLRRRSHEIAL
jgi:hypothetical protein